MIEAEPIESNLFAQKEGAIEIWGGRVMGLT
jgi:hypothetical protein